MLVLKKPEKDLFYLDGISKANCLIFVNVNRILWLHEDKKSDCNRGRISRHCMWIILTTQTDGRGNGRVKHNDHAMPHTDNVYCLTKNT